MTQLLTNFAVLSCKPAVRDGCFISGVDGGRSSVARGLQCIVKTLVHIVVVSNR